MGAEMPKSGRYPGFTAEISIAHRSANRYRQTPQSPDPNAAMIHSAGCSYYYGACAGHTELSCEFGDSSGICVGEGYAPVVVTCDGDVSYTEAQCAV